MKPGGPPEPHDRPLIWLILGVAIPFYILALAGLAVVALWLLGY